MKTNAFIDSIQKIWKLPAITVLENVDLPGTMLARIDIISSSVELKGSLSDELTSPSCVVLAHELRHVWQHANGWTFDDYNRDSSNIEAYNGQGVEVDAHAFAINICSIVFDSAPAFRAFSPGLRKRILERAIEQDSTESTLFDSFADVVDKLDEALSPSQLASAAGVSLATVYNLAKRLGRLPTVAELKAPRRPGPKKY